MAKELLNPGIEAEMFEMLGNQLFMIRDYRRAAQMLARALVYHPGDKAIRRKLIICYTQTGEVSKALELFHALIEEDIEFICNIDLVAEDCPCAELVSKMERFREQNRDSPDFNIILGILYLYCNLQVSLDYFTQSQMLDPDNQTIRSVLSIIMEYLRVQSPQKDNNYSAPK